MSEATATPTTQQAPEANGSGVIIKSYDDRVADVFGGTTEAAPTNDAPATPAAEPEADANAKARAERRAQYEALRAKERERVDAVAALRERDELRQKLAQLEASSKQRPANLIDLDELDEDGVLGLLERSKKTTPQKIAERMRELIANPELIATQAATRAVDPRIAALEKANAELRDQVTQFLSAQQQAQVDAQERHYANEFFEFTKANAASSPYAARFLEQHGPNEFYKIAQSAVQNVPAHGGAQAVLDEIEEQLTALGRLYQVSPDTGSQQRRQASPTPQNPAAAQAPTHVTNSLAQQRSSVVNEDEAWASLPFEERSARIFR